MTALEIVPNHQPCLLKLGQNPVYGRKPDLLSVAEQQFVDIFRTDVANIIAFKNLKNLDSGQRNLQTGVFEFLGFSSHNFAWSKGSIHDADKLQYSANYQATPGMSRRFTQPITLILIFVLLAGCSSVRFPGVHRITVQQGNVITQQMIDRLKPGMTRSQVRFVLGNAVIDDQLDEDRWDYIYSIQIAGGSSIRKVLSVYFVGDRLSYFIGDFIPTGEYEAFIERGSAGQAQRP